MQTTFSQLFDVMALLILIVASAVTSKPVELVDLPMDMDAALGGAALGLRIFRN